MLKYVQQIFRRLFYNRHLQIPPSPVTLLTLVQDGSFPASAPLGPAVPLKGDAVTVFPRGRPGRAERGSDSRRSLLVLGCDHVSEGPQITI